MTMLLRKMWKTHSKHKKLSEEWALAECEGEGWWREARDSGPGEVDVRYAGAAPVERAASAPATALAVRSALHSAKLINKKLQRVNLDISAKGIVVSDADSQQNVISVSIYRISYCSADAANARVFAVVEGKPMGGTAENHVVHVFVCTRRKHARALALSLAHAFNDAYQAWQANRNQGSSLGSDNKRLAPWVRFQEESDEEELNAEDWQSPAPLRKTVYFWLRRWEESHILWNHRSLREIHDGGRRCGNGRYTLCQSFSDHTNNINVVQHFNGHSHIKDAGKKCCRSAKKISSQLASGLAVKA